MTRTTGAAASILNRRVVLFFVLAFALTWAWWLPMLVRPNQWQSLHYVGSLGPMLAAILLTGLEKGRAGLRVLFVRMIRPAPPWLLLAIALPIASYSAGATISWAIGQPIDLGNFLGSKEYAHVGWLLVLIEVIFFGSIDVSVDCGWCGMAVRV
jgi:hypothetical protein